MMGLIQVADAFDISPNYLSRIIKQETGYTFVQYLSHLRMDKSNELLMQTDMQIKDIVSQIGYANTASFPRKFRQQEGITPGQYREKMRT